MSTNKQEHQKLFFIWSNTDGDYSIFSDRKIMINSKEWDWIMGRDSDSDLMEIGELFASTKKITEENIEDNWLVQLKDGEWGMPFYIWEEGNIPIDEINKLQRYKKNSLLIAKLSSDEGREKLEAWKTSVSEALKN